jgi:2-oxoglutarate dehydrogenase E2 component (dihydrolipoamide succinyltransferase)
MSSRTAFRAARLLSTYSRASLRTSNRYAPARQNGQFRFASVDIKVPTMAESLTEGTLKQFSKKVGDYVEVDEEIATIETDKVSWEQHVGFG